MVFPVNNLPSNAQPWTREVQKRVENIEATAITNEVNNVTRDAQLISSYKRINTIISNVFSVGTTEINGYNIKAGTIDATSINAGELTGFTIKTAASGTRLELAGTALTAYYNNAGTTSVTGSVYGNVSPVDGSVAMVVSSSTGGGSIYVANNSINIGSGAGATGVGIVLVRNSGISMYPGTGNTVSISSGNLSVGGTIGGNAISGSSLSSSGTLTVSSTSHLNDDIFYSSRPPSSIIGTPIHVRTSGANTNLLFDYTSSRKFKSDIIDLDIDYDKFISVPIRSFLYKGDETEYGTNAKRGYGYIAEELDEAGFTDLVVYKDNELGVPEPYSLAFYSVSAVTQAIVNKQAQMIKDLEARIIALENK